MCSILEKYSSPRQKEKKEKGKSTTWPRFTNPNWWQTGGATVVIVMTLVLFRVKNFDEDTRKWVLVQSHRPFKKRGLEKM